LLPILKSSSKKWCRFKVSNLSSNTYENARESSSGETLFTAVQKQAEANPHNVALIYEGKETSYKQLYDRIAAIAQQLRQLGVNKGDKVALLFPNHPEFVACLFAVVARGAVVVPVNPLLKSEEIEHILSDSNAKILIVDRSGLQEALAALRSNPEQMSDLRTIVVSGAGEVLDRGGLVLPNGISAVRLTEVNSSGQSTDATSTEQSSDATCATNATGRDDTDCFAHDINAQEDLALIVYTSGTTGKPKGAMLTHQCLVSGLKESLFDGFGISSSDRFLGTLPLCHIYGAGVLIYSTMAHGSSLVIMPKFDPAQVLALIKAHRVTMLPLVPSMYQFLLMQMDKETDLDLSSLRVCMCAASPLPRELHEQIEQRFGREVIEGYGSSETACGGTLNPLHARRVGSIGKPISCLEITIRGTNGEALPAGSDNVGEIAVRGPNVMKGYYRKPDATREAFADGGWFLTGDLGYADEDGYIYISGRKKELIIRGGSNIYPREVEEVIIRMDGVREVAVVGVPDKLMGERVKAVVVLTPGAKIDEEQVKEFCAQHLAQYKVPRIVEFIDALPRNATGKILKRDLV